MVFRFVQMELLTFGKHFKIKKNDTRYNRVFTYDWRLWSIPELRDILEEAGFKQTYAFWEGDNDKGGGNGIFEVVENAENCQSWVSYICALA